MFIRASTLLLLASAAFASTLRDFTPVKNDLKALFGSSQNFWPADYGHYGPFFVRLAWHCAGSYRTSDGRGGCDGGRQRFDPERSWADNTNLDKARKLLQPIKLKYGDSLSWGDLIILAGTTAIEDMGGPVLGFCGGRIDDVDGTASYKLGPTAEQEAIAPCEVNGECETPLGTTTVGLIYVNPEGPLGVPDPKRSAPQVRDTFGRMAMNDSETVALIGGGHAFGKTHGACPTGAGPAPNEQPDNPWPGTCGSGDLKGKGANAFTSGFEGPWTTTPITWSNEYFQNLLNFNWTVTTGPGGHNQWTHTDSKTMMLTTDVSLSYDQSFLDLVKLYATDIEALNHAFSHAWYKLTSRDMGPVTRCVGSDVPEAQPFQYPLPSTPEKLADVKAVSKLISSAINEHPEVAADLIRLAYQSASTFRSTDYLGGANGARIRFSPQSDWNVNNGLSDVIAFLEKNVISKYTGEGALSYADAIVLAGKIAVEKTSGLKLDFCAGRTDATDGAGAEFLTPREYDDSNILATLVNVRDLIEISGLSAREFIALQARLRTAAQQQAIGYSGSWNDQVSRLSNSFFKTLLSENWVLQQSSSGKNEYKAASKSDVFVTPQDVALIYDPEYLAIVQEYASNNETFLREFASSWTKLMNADRFDGPTGNVCFQTREIASAAAL